MSPSPSKANDSQAGDGDAALRFDYAGPEGQVGEAAQPDRRRVSDGPLADATPPADLEPLSDKKPPPDRKPPTRTCDQIYGFASHYHLCDEYSDQCRFYESIYPAHNTCDQICEAFGGTCISADVPKGGMTSTDKCTAASPSECSKSSYWHICTCSRP